MFDRAEKTAINASLKEKETEQILQDRQILATEERNACCGVDKTLRPDTTKFKTRQYAQTGNREGVTGGI